MFTKAFVKDLAERVIRTFAQAWVALLAADQGGLLHVSWDGTLSVAGLAALVAALNYIVAAPAQAVPATTVVVKPAGVR